MTEPAVQVQNVSKSFGENSALADVSLEVPARSLFALLGPNGGGKTTLFRILCGMLRPGAGHVRVGGFDVVHQSDQVRRLIGVVFQSPSLDRKLTAAENLRHHGHLHGLRGAPLRSRTKALLDQLGVADRADDRVETLSGGLARRVEIAKSLLPEPRVLLMDEPSTGLDVVARRELIDLLQNLRNDCNVTVVLTSHLMDEAQRCDQVCILDKGHVVAEGTPDELTGSIGGQVITIQSRQLESVAEKIRQQWQVKPAIVDGSIHVKVDRGAERVTELARMLGDRLDAVMVARPTLEDVFIQVTGRAFK